MFVDVIVPLAFGSVLSYQIPDENAESAQVGMRVLVPLGKKKVYTGIIVKTNTTPSGALNIKSIITILDKTPVITEPQLQLWQWISSYYMCTLGEVCKAALPTALKLESETRIAINDDFVADKPLPDTLLRILDILADGKQHTLDELSKKTDIKSVVNQVNRLIEIDAVTVDEHVAERYKARTESYVSLHPDISSPEQLQIVLNSALNRAPKQLNLLLEYLDLSGFNETSEVIDVQKQKLLEKADSNATILKQLTDKHILQVTQKKVDRLNTNNIVTRASSDLNDVQQQAFESIKSQWRDKNVVLLNGVTSSGKTEIYIKLIEEVISRGHKVLYLVPEIALTTQLTDRLQAVFGNKLGVYHSKYSDAERAETYQNILESKSYDVILGVRSSVFLPFHRLDLIIVDEEHDSSYKQQDPAPRYNARNTAIVLAQIHGAKVLLGTATPSIESYENARSGKYGLVELTQRYRNIRMPDIRIIDLKEAYRRKEFEGHFSDTLISSIRQALDEKQQVILFQNRRGYAPYISCKACGYVPKCVNCDVSLTVHKRHNILTCHYCGYTISLSADCPVCHQHTLIEHGFGTERIEDEVQEMFPDARVARMDLDTTRTRKSYESIIHDFSEHQIDILVGTQMVTKGLHFDDVQLVAVLNADNLLNQPDFRSGERAFQMLEQVSGRAGRKNRQGIVMIQTRQPDEQILEHVKNHDFTAFFNQQRIERETFRYPPFYRLMQITLKHRDEHAVRYIAETLQNNLYRLIGNRVSIVITPVIAWVQNMHIRHLMVRIETQASIAKAKSIIAQQIEFVKQLPDGKSAIIYVDVDPM